MSLLSRLRQSAVSGGSGNFLRRHFSSSSIPSPDSKPLSSKGKARAALNLIKAEQDPSKIVEICNAASLSPATHLGRMSLFQAVSKLAASNRLDLVSEFIEGLKTRPDLRTEKFVCNSMVLYGQARMASHAVRTFETVEDLGVDRSVRVLNSLMYACVLCQDYESVKRAFVEFTKVHDIEPDLETYNLVIRSFSESGTTSSAYAILSDMKRKQLQPNLVTFQNLLAGFYAEEKLKDVRKVVDLMKKHGIKGASMYNLRIRSLCKAKRISEATALLDEMVSEGIDPTNVAYSHLILGFCKEGNWEEAKKMLKSLGDKGLKPESSCYLSLVSFLCRGEDFDGALEVTRESIGSNVVPYFSTLKLLVEGLARGSKVAEAREVVSIVKEKFSKSSGCWAEIDAALPQ